VRVIPARWDPRWRPEQAFLAAAPNAAEIRKINEACDALLKGHVNYRFVIDNASLKL